MNKANECTCPSGDGSLVHPCPAHPAVEQVGGDERAAFEAAFAAMGRPVCRADYDQDAYGTPFDDGGWTGWQARAALAQPSPASVCATPAGENCPGDGVKSCKKCPEQPEAERPALWAVHAQGPDELYAGFSREDAEKHAAELNALPMPEGIAVGAVVVPSPWPAVQHWQYLAEQEQDHKNEIAARLRQLERICEGLPQDAIDGGWTVQGIRGYAKRLEDQLKAALARVAKMEACGAPALLAAADYFAERAKGPSPGWVTLSAVAKELRVRADKAPVAQAQHSVPIAPELKRALGLVVAALEADGDRPTSKYALSELKKVLAAAPGKEGV
ncbi:TPA: hypothetical protein NIH33_001987 [Pseudomonas aeruginosa]|uniref:hypothetical protein n=1 Tax=Pseudomonas aeruginosa TaxID=287 RepID=UPI000AEF3068|nr:hypothetical protein [Pseudomonas aeruginosa]MBG5430425.1 hypothetical protein [Pseudomonas aeruginosa]MBH3935300.1 hypothetical protein [Pseudomonas aeruginosa]MBP8353147.1 hypothetical protein [Pseudomonas aeruginosa]MBP8377375.1 hypothetical protein [Pseudomonas aeruginosa]HCF5848273.1 hypothetical protein [Pseudomonas aeruginosa]